MHNFYTISVNLLNINGFVATNLVDELVETPKEELPSGSLLKITGDLHNSWCITDKGNFLVRQSSMNGEDY